MHSHPRYFVHSPRLWLVNCLSFLCTSVLAKKTMDILAWDCFMHIYVSQTHPWHLWCFGQKCKWKSTYPTFKYLKVLNQANKLSNHLCFIPLAWQIHIHKAERPHSNLGFSEFLKCCTGLQRLEEVNLPQVHLSPCPIWQWTTTSSQLWMWTPHLHSRLHPQPLTNSYSLVPRRSQRFRPQGNSSPEKKLV